MDESQISDLLEQQEQRLQAAKVRKGQRATNKISRQQLLYQFNATQRIATPGAGYHMRICYIDHAYPPSTTPLADLKPINLSELKLETHHTGRVLIVRTFGHPIHIQSVQNAIEDKNLDVDRLAVYNGDPNVAAIHVLAKDTVFAIKEPFYKAAGDGGYIVRVDHPSDLVKLRLTHSLIPAELVPRLVELDEDVLTFKNTGNAAFKEKNYLSALKAYTEGLDACGEDEDLLKYDLYRNRSIVNIYLHRYEQASKDAVAALVPDVSHDLKKTKDNVKALYRAGRAFYFLERFSEARLNFDQLLKLSPEDKDGQEQLVHTKDRLEEAATGKFDFAAMSTTVNRGHKRLDHASFTTNVAIRNAGKKGRGLFATKDIKAGELILVEKALAVAFESERGPDSYVILNMNTNSGIIGSQAILFYALVQKMQHNPSQARLALELYDHNYSPKCSANIVDGNTVIDTFQVAAIVQHNAFGCANTSSIDEITKKASQQCQSVGVWLTASYINHACDANAHRSFVGDFMIVRASKDVAKNEEITISYRSRDLEHAKTHKEVGNGWKFRCECRMCTAESRTSAAHRKERENVIKELTAFLDNHGKRTPNQATITKAEKLYAKLDATYDSKIFTNVPRVALARLCTLLSAAYLTQSNPRKTINTANQGLNHLGYSVELQGTDDQVLCIDRAHCCMESTGVELAVCAAQACFRHGNIRLGEQYMTFAEETYQTLLGDMRRFQDLYRPR